MASNLKSPQKYWLVGVWVVLVVTVSMVRVATLLLNPDSCDGLNNQASFNVAGINSALAVSSTTISLGLAGISKLTGEITLDSAGINVASAGDVNNDGYDDVLIASKTNDATGADAGAAYLVYGKSAAFTSEGLGGGSNTVVKFTGEAAGDYSGTAVSGAGDVNNDGFDDFLIGAYQPNPPSTGNGAAYLIYGKAELFASTVSLGSAGIVKFTGEVANDNAGAKVGSAGDVNNDGYSDILITATGNDDAALNAGAAYLIYGQAAALVSANLSTKIEFTGEAASDVAGGMIGAGDFNGDSYSDILVSATGWHASNYGRTYVFYGQAANLSSTSLGLADTIFTGEVAEDGAGTSVSSAGDINNDGYDEILIGSSGNDDAGVGAGAVYLVYGQAAHLASATLGAIEFTGEAAGDAAGIHLGLAGDLNGDGFGDFLVGAALNNDAGADAGSAYLIYGQAAPFTSASLSTAALEFTGEAAGDRAGNWVSTGGDINGDGRTDIIIGSRFNDGGAVVDTGATYIVYSQPPFVSLSASTQTLSEAAGTGTVTAQLSAAFGYDVVIPYTVSGTATGGGVDHALANGNITVVAGLTTGDVNFNIVDDAIDDNDETIIVTLGTPSYGSLVSPTVQTITLTDNDLFGFTVSAISGNTTEAGGEATATIVLNSQPTADVTINLTSSDVTEGTVLPASLTFTSANWSDTVSHTVTVTGVNDFVDDGNIVYSITTSAATSADPLYNTVDPADIVAITNLDNDAAGFTVSAISGNTTEAGGTATATIVLTSEPANNVTVSLASSNIAEGTVLPASFTFTAGNWNTPQELTVTGVDDFVDDGDIVFSIDTGDAVSDDPSYGAMVVANVAVTNADDDGSGFTVSAISGNTTEVGGTATATIVLTSQPTASVTIGLSSSDTTEGTMSPASFTFTDANWNNPQTLTVTGVNDLVDDGDIAYSVVTAAAVSADIIYNGLNPADVVGITNVDNDTAGFTVSAISGSTTEAGATATATIVLTSEPTNDVTITLTTSDATEGLVTPASFTFTAGNWNVTQQLTVTGVDDLVDDGDISYSVITGSATSDDLVYSGLNPANVTPITNTDDDTFGMVLTQSDGSTEVREDGTTDSYSVVLSSQPVASVAVAIASTTSQVTTDSAALTFTTVNWATPQTVVVTAIDDDVIENNHSDILTQTVTSVDPIYDGYPLASVSVAIHDNDHSASPTAPDPILNAPKTISVVTPVLGTKVSPDATVNVAWNYTGAIPFVSVYLSTDDGTSWSTLETNISNSGSMSFSAPNIATTEAVVKVEGTDLSSVLASDQSPAFSISLVCTTPTSDQPSSDTGTPTPIDADEAEVAARVADLPDSVTINSLVKVASLGGIETQVDSAVYFIGADGYRHAFANANVYSSWYQNYDDVVVISLFDLAQIPMGLNVTYRPGVRMVKFQSSPKVYAINGFGQLRWVTSEQVAGQLYGENWNQQVDVISDTFINDYTFSDYIYRASDFNPHAYSSVVTPSDTMIIPGYNN